MSISSLSERSSLESLRTGSPALSIQSEPEPLTPALEGKMVWEGGELDPINYVVQLQESEIENIRAAVIHFKMLNLPRGRIDKETFPLGERLAERLSTISNEVHHGRGIAVVRGLGRLNLNDEEAVIAHAGVSSYVGPLRATDAYANQTLSHIRDATHDVVPAWARNLPLAGSKLPSAMEFHCDRFSGDILTLHVRNDGGAEGGGEQYVASFWRIYNELLATEPEALETMAEADWPFELKKGDKSPYLERGPALFFAKGKPICQLVKAPLLGSPRIPRSTSMPAVSMKQAHALQVVEDLARRFCTRINRQTGDIQFINNLSIMHARAAYSTKGIQRGSSRHLLRMFLRDPRNAWAKPCRYEEKFDGPFAAGREQNLPVVDSDPWRKISGRESHG
ncbi:Clavaminate synthase-like protein [Zopfia rhizophila CBS 207.26]|uniref:Clavaminate synthase-like protein n=1 Tax=Zopfia rhizophila CBS 207.26 TaxID=1314779 RepID=A0A6A6EJA2_9PEZI|nr:Clavaminate synthase-like protein [Zopfia rhizophila CBS 207.26]